MNVILKKYLIKIESQKNYNNKNIYFIIIYISCGETPANYLIIFRFFIEKFLINNFNIKINI